jgi:hypothetical protein
MVERALRLRNYINTANQVVLLPRLSTIDYGRLEKETHKQNFLLIISLTK